jgi:hypothetical protein
MKTRELSLMCCLTAMWLGGCGVSVPDTSFPQSAEIDGSGVSSGKQTKSISCTNTITSLDRDLSGSGAPTIQVTDGSGKTVYSDDGTDVQGSVDDSQSISGANGTWTLTVDPQGFSGTLKITLHCP